MAGEEELALLRERLRAPAPRSVQDIASIRLELLGRLDPPLKEAWPASTADLADHELGFTPEETVVHVRYKAEAALDDAAQEMLMNLLRSRLDAQRLRVSLEHLNSPPPPPQSRRIRTAARPPVTASSN